MSQSPKPWKTLSSEFLLTLPFAKFRKDVCLLPDGRKMPGYYTLEFKDWVNVIPVTPEGKIIFVEQYRHAFGEVTLEIPGGTTHNDTDFLDGAKRELLEETGYASEQWSAPRSHQPNPALLSNSMHTYLALNCKKVAEPTPDPYEDLRTVLLTKEELQKTLREGHIRHSVVLASLLLFWAEIEGLNNSSGSELQNEK